MMMSALHAMEQGFALGPLVGIALLLVVGLPFKLAQGIRRFGEPSTETRLLTALFYAYGVRGLCLSLLLLFPHMPHRWLLLVLNAACEYATFALIGHFFVAGVLRVAPQSRRAELYGMAYLPVVAGLAAETALFRRGDYFAPQLARLAVPSILYLAAAGSWLFLELKYMGALPLGGPPRWLCWLAAPAQEPSIISLRLRPPSGPASFGEPIVAPTNNDAPAEWHPARGLRLGSAFALVLVAVLFAAQWHAGPIPSFLLGLCAGGAALLVPIMFVPYGLRFIRTVTDEQRSMRALYLGVAVASLLTWPRFGKPYEGHADALTSGACAVVMLGVLLVVLYYRGRFVFVDVLLKGVARTAAMALAAVAVVFPAVWLGKPFAGGNIETLVPLIAVIMFAVGWKAADTPLSRWLDRHLFQRPNYVQVATALARDMRSRATAEDAIAVTTEGLARGLSANSVRFLPPAARPAPDAAALASVALGERRFGTLVLGPRVHRWPYQSEDLDFTSTVARFLAEALDSIEKRCERDATARRELELRELAARAEARALRARIDPHFLFNALNTLADLIRDDPAAAERAVLDLSGVFRFALDASGRESVPVADEVEFLRAYLDIERLRFEGRLRYEIDFPDALNDRVIPPMLIQPLVENAVRHGVAPRPEGGTVRVSVRSNDGRLTVRVEDDGVGFDVGGTAAQQGVGLANVRDRVTRFFGPEAWHLESRPGRGTLVELNLPAAHATGTAQPQEGA